VACRGVLYAIGADDAQTLLTVAAEAAEEDFQYIWAYFQDARELAAEAAGAGRAVLFIADQ
jgi:hypothetical protein